MAKYASKIKAAKKARDKANKKSSKKVKKSKNYRSNHHEAYYTKTIESNNSAVLADFHVHSQGSSDGKHDIQQLLSRAKHFGVKYLSITDHNNFNETLKLLNHSNANLKLAMHDFEGLNFVPGVEVTCRVNDVKNYKGNDLKVHLLIYAPILTKNSYLARLMEIKHGNDLAVDFGMLFNIARVKGIGLDPEAIRNFMLKKRTYDSGFSSFGRDDVYDFFAKYKIPIAKSMREFTELYDSLPRAERLNLSAKEVIDLAHASGGICVMAHPKTHLNRTSNKREAVNTLLEYGIDGFELMSSSMDNETFGLITNECADFSSKNKLLFTGGSDFHVYSSCSKMGEFGGMPITTKSQSTLISELEELDLARRQKCLTSRDYNIPIHADLEDTIKKYSTKAHEINEIYYDNSIVHNNEDDFSFSTMTYIQYLKEHGVYKETRKQNNDGQTPID